MPAPSVPKRVRISLASELNHEAVTGDGVLRDLGALDLPAIDNASSINSVPVQDGKAKVKVTVDSGAAESVIPRNCVQLAGSAASPLEGTVYAAANGSPLINEGQRVIRGLTKDGRRAQLKFQVTDVHKCLAAVSRMTAAGNRVVFDDDDPEGSFILHKASGTKTPLVRENGVYVFEMLVDVGASATATSPAGEVPAQRTFRGPR